MGNTLTSTYPSSSQGPYSLTASILFIYFIYRDLYYSILTLLLFILFNIHSTIPIYLLIMFRCLLCDYELMVDESERC